MGTINKKIEKENSFFIQNVGLYTDLNKYLNDLDLYLTNKGFKKYNQNIKNEDCAYWKIYNDKYQIGLLVYDFRKYKTINTISIQFECMLTNIDCRCDLVVSKSIELHDFEEMAKTFYDAMSKYC